MSTANIIEYIKGEFQQVNLQAYTGSSTVVTSLITTKDSVLFNVASYDVRVYADAGRVTEITEGTLSNQLTFFRDSDYATDTGEDIVTGFILNSATYEGTVYVDSKVVGGYVKRTAILNPRSFLDGRYDSQELEPTSSLSVSGWHNIAEIPEDNEITEFELKGKPIIDISEKSKSLQEIGKLVEKLFSAILLK